MTESWRVVGVDPSDRRVYLVARTLGVLPCHADRLRNLALFLPERRERLPRKTKKIFRSLPATHQDRDSPATYKRLRRYFRWIVAGQRWTRVTEPTARMGAIGGRRPVGKTGGLILSGRAESQ